MPQLELPNIDGLMVQADTGLPWETWVTVGNARLLVLPCGINDSGRQVVKFKIVGEKRKRGCPSVFAGDMAFLSLADVCLVGVQ